MQLLIASRSKDLSVPYCSLPDSKLFPKTFLIFRKSQCSSSIPSNHLISYYSSFFFYPQLQIALPTPLSLYYYPPPFCDLFPLFSFFNSPIRSYTIFSPALFPITPYSLSYYSLLLDPITPTLFPISTYLPSTLVPT